MPSRTASRNAEDKESEAALGKKRSRTGRLRRKKGRVMFLLSSCGDGDGDVPNKVASLLKKKNIHFDDSF